MVEALLFVKGEAEGTPVNFDALTLRFSLSNEWADAVWELATATSTKQLSAPSIEEIAGIVDRFDAKVIDGRGVCQGPFSIQTVIGGFPHAAFCFLFQADTEGMWSGYTVAKSFGEIVVVPYRTDPT
jgi:hypothetical protein